ncbi:MAG: hypothetical protein MRERV_36c024 [Mycoplasmataceae bacterium RV_VA103A]|nr:MAG: hypothetical protein MRERV_36c024 [Mycoplasmataceae bacterium RV_VA103A]
MRNNLRPKQLNLNPLSVAKFFYEKLGKRGVEQPFIHPALYLTYREILKKENIGIFKEEFEDWETTPALPSVYVYLEKNNKPTFHQIPDITNEIVIHHLENISRRYQRQYKNGELELFTCDLQFKAQKLAGNL